jgi:hypothetical protein
MELAQDRVQWRALVLAVLNLRVLLPESQLISKMDLTEISCEDERWMELAQDRVKWRALVLAVLDFMFPILVTCLITQVKQYKHKMIHSLPANIMLTEVLTKPDSGSPVLNTISY